MATTFHDPTVRYVTDALFRAGPGALPLAALARAVESRHGVVLSHQRLRDVGTRFSDQLFLLEGVSEIPDATHPGDAFANLGCEETGPWMVLRQKADLPGEEDAHSRGRLLSRVREALGLLAEQTDVTSRTAMSRWIVLGLEAQALFRRVIETRPTAAF